MTLNFNSLSPWLDNLPFQWNAFEGHGKYINFDKGDHIFHYGDTLQNVYIVLSGRIRLYLITSDGKEKTIAIMGRNGLLGEQFLTSHESQITSAVVVSDSYLLEIEKSVFMKIALENIDLTRQWLEILSIKLEITYSIIFKTILRKFT